jgi:uncharacterized protein
MADQKTDRSNSTSAKYARALRLARAKGRDHPLVLSLLREALKEESPHAAWALGTWYLHGHGSEVPQDFKRAFRLLKTAAKANIPNAHYDLGVCYEKAEGTKKDLKKAFLHYLSAMVYGDKQAMRSVARCYYHGIGTKKDVAVGRIFWRRWKELKAKS